MNGLVRVDTPRKTSGELASVYLLIIEFVLRHMLELQAPMFYGFTRKISFRKKRIHISQDKHNKLYICNCQIHVIITNIKIEEVSSF